MWTRLRFWWHDVHGGAVMEHAGPDRIRWRCVCGASLGASAAYPQRASLRRRLKHNDARDTLRIVKGRRGAA